MERPRIVIAVQRDLIGEIAGFVVVLAADGKRTPLCECDTLTEANTEARALMQAHHARSVEIDNPTEDTTDATQ